MMNSLEEIRLPNTICPPIPKKDMDIVGGEKEWFIRGNIPGSWIGKASSLPGNYTLHVALAIWHVKGFKEKSNKVILDRFHFDRFNVRVDSTRRALRQLQKAGLIEYMRVGHKHHVTILSVKPESKQNNHAAPQNITTRQENDLLINKKRQFNI